MIHLVAKYLNGELTTDQKKSILLSANENETLRNDLIEFNHLMAHLSLLPANGDSVKAQKGLTDFLNIVDNKKDSK
ncbi:MAG: hypothetical protein PHR83_11435 [Paludibacter sp.]|nr:hypothetical protein [Paludibacter sp.]